MTDLQIAAYPKTKEKIRIPLTKEDIYTRSLALADNLNSLDVKEAKLAEIKKEYAEEMAPLKRQNAQLLNDIKNQYVDVEREVYQVPDYDHHMIDFIDAETGEKIGDRRMTFDERQGNLFHNK